MLLTVGPLRIRPGEAIVLTFDEAVTPTSPLAELLLEDCTAELFAADEACSFRASAAWRMCRFAARCQDVGRAKVAFHGLDSPRG